MLRHCVDGADRSGPPGAVSLSAARLRPPRVLATITLTRHTVTIKHVGIVSRIVERALPAPEHGEATCVPNAADRSVMQGR